MESTSSAISTLPFLERGVFVGKVKTEKKKVVKKKKAAGEKAPAEKQPPKPFSRPELFSKAKELQTLFAPFREAEVNAEILRPRM
ncbi:MAG: hypothetical protein VX255_20610, partial [Candidatus Latescibacterota bacterium]|nr:hypothetical protein [Candidatus Latescibacterota bacterium]